MSEEQPLQNRVRAYRLARGWSQEMLALRTGISRTGISAIETGRFVPSTATALTLATVFGCRVEDVFSLDVPEAAPPAWAWPPPRDPCRYWRATVADKELLYPVEPTNLGTIPHDGVAEHGVLRSQIATVPRDTLVIACCDPAVGLLAGELRQTHGIRLLALQRPSRAAIAMLAQGLIHAAGVHLSEAGRQPRNAAAAKDALHRGFTLLRVARWQEGLAASPTMRIKATRASKPWWKRCDLPPIATPWPASPDSTRSGPVSCNGWTDHAMLPKVAGTLRRAVRSGSIDHQRPRRKLESTPATEPGRRLRPNRTKGGKDARGWND